MRIQNKLNKTQLFLLLTVRVLLGWYFLYEGCSKLLHPHWTAIGFLKSSEGWFSSFFISISENPNTVDIINFLNIWGLIAIGLGLILGALSQVASIAAICILTLYYLAHPPLINTSQQMLMENTLWVDKNLIFIAILLLLYSLPTSHIIGIDRFLFKNKRN
ncbi:DoxX family protein [Carboxylicivirga sp. N1Y90]|uniref:DoxX family protein n=1 Tax=Carboxylicivirga fragile TaxID=3417571 RepID=UPI003D33287F|nr:DoxX family protein [Marinilabiliaceae bacterium N1Y90]